MVDERGVTELLKAWRDGEEQAEEELIDKVYPELQKIASAYLRRERPGHTLQTAGLVNEAYLKLAKDVPEVDWRNRAHFFGFAARVMRQVLVEYARHRRADKRGKGEDNLPLEETLCIANEKSVDLISLDEALSELAKHDSLKSRIVELRYFGGLNTKELTLVLGISDGTVRHHWDLARAWLYHYMKKKT